MSPAPSPQNPDRPFYDVFISYRHRDAEAVERLAQDMEAMGYKVFCDSHFTGLNNPDEIKRETIEVIRQHIAKATCLIVAYSRESAQRAAAKRAKAKGAADESEPIGVWMPWELGYFDGAMSSRIGVYLLDGPRDGEDVKAYYKGCEYLQIYDEVVQNELPVYLARMGARERRIDNTRSAFLWLEHLGRECLANPANVCLGVMEWYTAHAANVCRAWGLAPVADAMEKHKTRLDDLRLQWTPAWRSPFFDELRAPIANTQPDTVTPAVTLQPGLPDSGATTLRDWRK
jgi:hypothetical protein